MKNVADVYHLTPVQREVLKDKGGVRVMQNRWQLRGELNAEAFEHAWQQLLARHTMLRTCFLTEQLDEPVQVVRQQAKLIYERYDLRGVELARQQAELLDLLRMDRQREFVAAKTPLFRVLLLRLGDQSYELVLSHHPVLLDAHSVELILDDVLSLYRAELQNSDGVNAAPAAYRDYVSWVERQDLAGAELYWRSN